VSVAYVTLKWTGKKYRKNGETSSLPIDQVPDIVVETGQMQTNTCINTIQTTTAIIGYILVSKITEYI